MVVGNRKASQVEVFPARFPSCDFIFVFDIFLLVNAESGAIWERACGSSFIIITVSVVEWQRGPPYSAAYSELGAFGVLISLANSQSENYSWLWGMLQPL